jgi:hypothetical protein
VTDREPIDVARVVKDWLKADLASRFPELSVRLELPSDWMLQSNPVLVVADDGDPLVVWPVATSPTIRVTSWTSGRDRTYIHAALTRLLTAQIPGIAKRPAWYRNPRSPRREHPRRSGFVHRAGKSSHCSTAALAAFTALPVG